ncbi:MAG: sulfate reduction electron transfer complex DsrMKJOP subunit DsrP [Desulfatibacillaceae bacterium]
MLDKAIKGDGRYWGWIFFLLAVIGVGFVAYLYQYFTGLGATGMSRDISWGIYISQLTYLVGVAASGVMLVLPFYLHKHKVFGQITIFGEFMAVGAVLMCLLFVMVDLGQPMRLFNVVIHPTPNSVLFWDMVVLNVYMFLNIIIGWMILQSDKKGDKVAKWVKVLIYISIPWAISIHTVTAFLYSGLPGRHFWLSAIMAPRFLASAFCAGPAILLLILLVLQRMKVIELAREAIGSLAKIITYAMIANVFFLSLELFTAFYSNIPGHEETWVYLFAGLKHHGHYYAQLMPFMVFAGILGILSLILLIPPQWRNNPTILPFALVILVIATWIDKGLGLVIGGFIPNPLMEITEYAVTIPEILITLGVYGIGALVVTLLFKIAIEVQREVGHVEH